MDGITVMNKHQFLLKAYQWNQNNGRIKWKYEFNLIGLKNRLQEIKNKKKKFQAAGQGFISHTR